MDAIDVRDLPEPLARAIETMVHLLREQLRENHQQRGQRIEFLIKHGAVIGSVKREDIYGDI